jgi:hypothetical protein
MPLLPIKLPPGVVRSGTEYGSKGRYYDTWLVRWNDDGTLKPIGGWRNRTTSGALTGKARAVLAWKDNSETTWLMIGTHAKLQVQDRAGHISDVTPSAFASGNADATATGGYGAGTYNNGSYGTPRPDSTLITDATVWTLDTFGQMPLGVSSSDGRLYQWDLNTSHAATAVAGAPTARGVVVTPERFCFLLGTTDPRTVSWADQESLSTWTPDATNQAGDFSLQTAGRLMCGKVIKGGTLLFTDLDVHLAQYIGGQLVYSFDKVGSACGIISRQAVATLDAQAVWMGKTGFWLFNGYVQPLPCAVADLVFGDLNPLQVSKTTCVRDSAHSEVTWFYCSGASGEIDRCVVWNYKNNWWLLGRPNRTCGTDRGVFTYPIMLDANGTIYEHEVGLAYDGSLPYAEGGPIELGNGDASMNAEWLIPDDKTKGDVSATFYGKQYPDGGYSAHGPYTLDKHTDVRFEARQVKVRFTGARLTDWRVGEPRLDVRAAGAR